MLNARMPHLAPWQWLVGTLCAYMIGIAKTGAPGVGTLMAPLMVLMTGDARLAAGWTLPTLSTADVFAVVYWRRHADAKKLFSLIPWTLAGMAAGTAALSLAEPVLRAIVAGILFLMLGIHLLRKFRPEAGIHGSPSFFGIVAGFATTVANASGPVMNLYLLSKKLSKEQFVATGAWFFFVLNLAKIPIYAWYHLFSRDSLLFNLMEVPMVLAGALTGRWLVQVIPQKMFDSMVVVLTVLCSAALLF
ncbi:MAG TPA: sulfite exporter TauE/SafE family protein [Bryobacteraceae bacterium]|jgi:hypothetical protein